MVRVKLVNVTKRFGDVVAVDDVSFEVKEGELFTLLGPSGCGKTTTLRLIAGFYKPDEGEIYFDSEIVNDVPPYKRNTGMVFQNYALWPHMTVFDNIAYGLKLRGIPPPEIIKRVKEIIEVIGLKGKELRYPSQLSGGEQQRVALARALVIKPKVLLLDEPLSNLDAKLRLRMRGEIRKIQKKFGITTIYVTHDQEEALSLSDRIAVMNAGKIQQIGTPLEIYEKPNNVFVADFIGTTNFLKCTLVEASKEKGKMVVEIEEKNYIINEVLENFSAGSELICAIRPESVEIYDIDKAPKDKPVLIGKVLFMHFLGGIVRLEVVTEGGQEMKVDVRRQPGQRLPREGDKIALVLNPQAIRVFKR